MTDYKFSALTQATTLADGDMLPVVITAATSTPAPAGAGGSNQKIAAADAAVAFYRGATRLVLPVSGNSASGNATAIQAAITAVGGPGVVKLAPVAWNIACGTVSYNGSGLYLDLEGCTVTASGTGDLFRMYDSSTYDTRTVHGGGLIGYPFIDGTSATGAACPWHAGDIFKLRSQYLAQNFTGTGARGFFLDNQWAIGEQGDHDVWVSNCTTHYEWSQNPAGGSTGCFGSFERNKLKLSFSQVDPAFAVFKFSNGVYFGGSKAFISGNAAGQAGGSALTSAMFYATGTTPSGSADGPSGTISSNFADVDIFSNIELTDNNGSPWTFTPTTFKVDGSCFFGNLTGRLDFAQAGVNFTPTSAVVGFYGETDGGDPNIVSQTTAPQLFQGQVSVGTYAAGASLASNGTISTAASWAIVAPTANVTGVILGAGAWDGQLVNVYNGSAFTVTFAAAGTSNVADGTVDVIPPNSLRQYWWSVDSGQWIPMMGLSRQRVILGTAFTAPSSASAQNVTGMAVALAPGTYKVTGCFLTHQTAGTGTMKIAWTFGGTISAAVGKWLITQGTAQVIATVTSVTTQTASSSALSSASLYLAEFTGIVTVSAAGTLQLQTQASATGTQVQFPVGSYVEAEPLA